MDKRQALWGLAAGLLGALLNLAPVELVPAVHVLLGSVAVLAVAVLVGPWAGGLAGLLVGLPTYFLWGHPLGWMAYVLEGVIVGMLRRRYGPLRADGLWWLLGIPLLSCLYPPVLGLGWSEVFFIPIKLALNNLVLALGIEVALLAPPVRRRLAARLPPPLRQARLGTVAGLSMALCVALPLLVVGVMEGKARHRAQGARAEQDVGADARAAATAMDQLLAGGLRAARIFAESLSLELARTGSLPPAEELEERLAARVRNFPELANAYVGNAEGRAIAFWPPRDAQGRPLAGFDFSTRPYVRQLRETRAPLLSHGFIGRGGVQGQPVVVAVAPVLDARGELVAYVLCAFDLEALERTLNALLGTQRRALLVDPSGQLVLDTATPGAEPALTLVKGTPLGDALDTLAPGERTGRYMEHAPSTTLARARAVHLFSHAQAGHAGWKVVVERPASSVRAAAQSAYAGLLSSLLVAVAAAGLGALVLGRMLVRPLRMVTRASERFAAGESGMRVADEVRGGPLEVVQLASTFDHLVSELSRRMAHLETANREKDAFLSAASHELKTPLATLKLRVQSLQRVCGPRGPQGPRMEQLTRQVDRMTRLIHQMLDVTELSNGQLTLEPTHFDLAQVVRAMAEEVVGSSPHHTLALELSGVEGLWDRRRLEQVLFNLLHNAVKFSPEGGRVEVTLGLEEEGTVALSVRDRGVGLAGLEGATLLRRFARGSQPGVARVGGLGVGLYLSRAVVERHGGTLTLESREGGGAVACVRLPRWRNANVGEASPAGRGHEAPPVPGP